MERMTKERILDEALEMFAQNGYKGTNLRELAQRLKLSKSALYKHYKSKEDIWQSVLDCMENYYRERFGSQTNLPPVPQSGEALMALTMDLVRFTVEDRRVVLSRRLLLSEQFRDDRVCRLATEHFLTGLQQIFTDLFGKMMEAGTMHSNDPALCAMAFTPPIMVLIHWCDREPDKKEDAMERIRRFVTHFIDTYGICN